jgi:hypothetical protein
VWIFTLRRAHDIECESTIFHPWGKVAISYDVNGAVDPGTILFVCAKDTVSGKVYYANLVYLSGDIDVNEGSHRVVWDKENQGVSIDSKKVVFTVSYGLYLIVDLSAGKDAESYPVSCMYSEPIGGWTDEYKTTKLVLRRIESGSFKMNGSYDVTLTKPYYMGVFEITQKQYELVAENRSSVFIGNTLPKEEVSWNSIRGNSDAHNWSKFKMVDVIRS